MKGESVLEVKDVSVYYARIEALSHVSIEVGRGETVALLGANGAGKSTLLETILGINKPSEGTILFNDIPITGRPPDRIVRGGISLVPEGRGIFSSLSVYDNLMLGSSHRERRKGEKEEMKLRDVFAFFPVLSSRRNQSAGTLSGGERQMLAIARALMGRPSLIMIDEPSLGLAPKVMVTVFSILASLHKEGYSILLSEQNANLSLRYAERGYVLEAGRVILKGKAEELRDNPTVREAYLGA